MRRFGKEALNSGHKVELLSQGPAPRLPPSRTEARRFAHKAKSPLKIRERPYK